jgi:tRNA threonylcarbamoyladenosine biosynthesis protein TsaB
MSRLLLIESGTNVCSVAIATNDNIVGLKESSEERAHASQLTVFIDLLLKETGITIAEIDAVAVSKGPGSYTGLRIGVSAAKGICYGADKPLISIGSLESMAHGANSLYKNLIRENGIDLICPMIDARRMEVYSTLFDTSNNQINEVEALVVDNSTFKTHLDSKRILFLGNGAVKCREAINHANAFFVNDFSPSAQFMIPLALKALANKTFEDVAYFEPYYLKDFVATKSLKKVFPGM